jgi:hypothetical protein
VSFSYRSDPLVSLFRRLDQWTRSALRRTQGLCSLGSWHFLETFDSTAPEFAGSTNPAGAAERAAWRAGSDLKRRSTNVSRFELRPRGEAGQRLISGSILSSKE